MVTYFVSFSSSLSFFSCSVNFNVYQWFWPYKSLDCENFYKINADKSILSLRGALGLQNDNERVSLKLKMIASIILLVQFLINLASFDIPLHLGEYKEKHKEWIA